MLDERTKKFVDNIIEGRSNEELYKPIERDPTSEAITAFMPGILGALTGEAGALSAPEAGKQARNIYESQRKEQQDSAAKSAELRQKAREKMLEREAKTEKELVDNEFRNKSLEQQNELKRLQIEATSQSAKDRLEAAKEARAARVAVEKNLPQNVYQAATFSQRVEDANKQIEDLMSGGYDPASVKQTLLNKFSPEALKGNEAKLMEQAQRNYINAILRRESGAAISPSEFENAEKQYFPQIGDSSEVLGQKKRNREVALAGLKTEGAKALERMQPNLPQQKSTESKQKPSREEMIKALKAKGL